MNEEDQVKAIAAEYRALGYRVRRDVKPSLFGIKLAHSTGLDLVAYRGRTNTAGSEQARPRIIIVEIANRSRPEAGHSSGIGARHSVARFEAISEALGRRSNPSILFLIRFLDVSKDQADARSLKRLKVRSQVQLEKALASTRETLEDAKNQPQAIHSLILAREWANWLRIMAHRFPATRGELKYADLRAVQKDLYDGGIIKLEPGAYYRLHRHLMAIQEGGDVSWGSLQTLAKPLNDILSYVEDNVLRLADRERPGGETEDEGKQ